MYWLHSSLFVISLLVLQTIANETPKCDPTDKSLPYLDAAMDLITTAKGFHPVCPGISANRTSKPIDCSEVLRIGYNESGVYTIWPKSRVSSDRPLDVYCDMDTDGGGWMVLQRRGNYNRSNDYFFQDWAAYKSGFGDNEKDFWLGNDNIFALTNQRLYSIRIDLKAVDGETRHALYDTFWIDDEINKYTLRIKGYSGDSGDSMATHDNQKFSTKDQDNDNAEHSCALSYKGGWWYNACHSSNLNGLYLRGKHESYANGVNWNSWRGYHESLDTAEMKIRPKDFRRNLISVDTLKAE